MSQVNPPPFLILDETDAALDDELLERSAQEARLVARLPHHPNIVAIHAVRRLGPRSLALVMQFVPGGTLRETSTVRNALASQV